MRCARWHRTVRSDAEGVGPRIGSMPTMDFRYVAGALDWQIDGADWPHREASRFVECAGQRWHLQEWGSGPWALLIHGTGATIHSWRSFAPLLATRYRVLMPDLPGHGFSGPARSGRATLPGMSSAMADLLRELGVAPDLVIGHSAGAAIMVQMALDGLIKTRQLVGINGALMPFEGMARILFSPAAKVLAATPLAARAFAWAARDPAAVRRLLASTGSSLDERGVELYARLVRNARHVEGALQMMAGWDLRPLTVDLPRLRTPLRLLAAEQDLMVPPAEAARVQMLVKHAEVRVLQGVGHLAHEENPAQVAALIPI